MEHRVTLAGLLAALAGPGGGRTSNSRVRLAPRQSGARPSAQAPHNEALSSGSSPPTGATNERHPVGIAAAQPAGGMVRLGTVLVLLLLPLWASPARAQQQPGQSGGNIAPNQPPPSVTIPATPPL
jgi:hypothetical protein